MRSADFCIEVDFKKDSPNPSRVFRTITNLIDTFESLDEKLVHSISGEIKPILLLENVESGSIKTWLKQILQEVDDEALKNLDWKPQVGKYLVRAKYLFIDFIEKNTTITDRADIVELRRKLLGAAEDTQVLRIPVYTPLPDAEIANTLRELSSAVEPLQPGDSVKYLTNNEQATFNLEFHVSPETIEDLLTEETITSRNEMILKVKKPDFLGESMWTFKHETRTIEAKILDVEWLRKFQMREEEIRPGDSLRALVEIDAKYGFDAEVIAIHYRVTKILQVIKARNPRQEGLF